MGADYKEELEALKQEYFLAMEQLSRERKQELERFFEPLKEREIQKIRNELQKLY